ncbi:hypothetical protein HHI36_000658 [Cryptolaemus montrouzieri]|uniref:Uncharacterized protein n=1 Tax=Cryptolaemus montrouzieri TaxID=559131 RepID=A0ABD2P5Q8_9CUCU
MKKLAMGDFNEAQRKYSKSLLSDFNAKMKEKIELVELVETELEKNKSPVIGISDADSLGKVNEKPIIVEFISHIKKIEVLKSSAKLKGTGMFLSNDLVPEERMQQKILVGRMRKERRLQGLSLVINRKFYTLKQLEERRKNESGFSGAVNDSSRKVQ